jgi:PAS domain S-box-containing protein
MAGSIPANNAEIQDTLAADSPNRKRVKEAVRKSEERFRHMADSVPVMIWITGTDKLCTYVNKLLLDFTGRSLAQDAGFGWLDSIHPDDAHRCVEEYEYRFTRRERFRMEYRLRRYDGQYRWILNTGAPRYHEDGSFAGYIGCAVDVTERKQTEEALQVSEERLRLAQQAARMGTFDWDVKNGVLTWTTEMEALYGLRPGSFAGTRDAYFALVHPEDRENVRRLSTLAMQSGQPTQGEWRIVWPDRSIHWIAAQWRVLMNEQGEPARVIGVNSEITERKRVEENLKQSEERFRLAAQAANMFAFEWDVLTDVVRRSAESTPLLERDEPRETTGRQLTSRVHPDDRETVLAAIAAISRESPTYHISYRSMRPSGKEIWAEVHGVGHFDDSGKLLRIIGMAADITERKLAEESQARLAAIVESDAIALRESQERWHLAAQAGKMYAYEWNAESDVIVRAGELSNVFGQSINGLRLTRQQLLERIHPDDRAQFNASVAERTPENPDTQSTYRVMRPDGCYVWVQKTAHAFFDEQGKMLRMIGMVADITERKRAEDALREVSRKLVKVQEDERTRIARDLHDDINQRLAVLAIDAEQLKQNSCDSGTVANGLTELQQQISKISLAVQSISHQLHSPHLEYLGIVGAMKSLCREFAVSQKWEIDFNADEITQPVPQEVSVCLFRVLQEAVHNAAKYSKTRTLQVSLRRQPDHLELTISDRGIGFEIEASTNKSGLGLVSMRERVRLIGGSIDVNSAPMCGTTIRVCAPLSHPASDGAGIDYGIGAHGREV